MSFSDEAKKAAQTIGGLLISASGGFFLWLYLKPPSHTVSPSVIYVFAGWIAVGASIAWPSVIGGAFKQLAALLPSIKIGGGSP